MSDEQRNRGDAILGQVFFLFCLALTLFNSPAIIVIWPFSESLHAAITTACTSILAWLWSAACWTVVFLVVRSSRK
jgi:hypothetical protein